MSFAPKTALSVLLAVSVLSLLLMASWNQHTAIAQQPDYTTQCSNGIAVPHPQNNPGLVSDCAALLTAKDALDPDGQHLDWSDNVSIHDWGGIEIESTLDGAYFRDRVVALGLWFMTGSIPSELGSLANLRWLELKYGQLTGSIPSELGNLANLRELDLSENQLTGSIPSELGNLANLDDLYLNDIQLTGSIPPELGNLTNLRELDLSENQLTSSIPSELGNLANLDDLYLNDNQLTGSIPPDLGNLTNLGNLYLSGNQLTGCIPTALSDVQNHDFGSLGLPLCAASVATPTPTPSATSIPTPMPTPQPTATYVPTPTPSATPIPTPVATPMQPTVPDEVLNRLSAIETLLATLQSLIVALESRIAALEAAGANPGPTPTQTPAADACLTSIPSDGATNGSWSSACATDRNLVTANAHIGTRYAGYYTFALSQQSEVTITLESSEDTYLFLLSGHGRNGEKVAENDDIDTDAQNYNSRVVVTLAEGEYTILATTYNLATAGDFTLTVSGIR